MELPPTPKPEQEQEQPVPEYARPSDSLEATDDDSVDGTPGQPEQAERIQLGREEVSKVIRLGWGDRLVQSLDSLDISASHDELIRELIQSNQGNVVAEHLHQFQDASVSQDTIAEALLNTGQGEALATFLAQFDDLSLTHDQIARTLLDTGQEVSLLRHISNFSGLQITQDSIAQELLDLGKVSALLSETNLLRNLSSHMQLKLMQIKLRRDG